MPKEPLFLRRQQLVTPGDGIAHGLLPGRRVPLSSRQQRESVGQARENFPRRQDIDAGSGKLNRQGQSIQLPADLPDRRRVCLVERKLGADRACPLHEKRDGIGLHHFCDSISAGFRDRQRRHQIAMFPVDVERNPAGYERLDAWAHPEHVHQPGWRLAKQVFEVVQHQQEVLVSQGAGEHVSQQLVGPRRDPQRPDDTRQYLLGFADGCQRQKSDAIGKLGLDTPRHLDRKARFSDAARSHQGQDPRFVSIKEPQRLTNLRLPSDQGGQRGGQRCCGTAVTRQRPGRTIGRLGGGVAGHGGRSCRSCRTRRFCSVFCLGEEVTSIGSACGADRGPDV